MILFHIGCFKVFDDEVLSTVIRCPEYNLYKQIYAYLLITNSRKKPIDNKFICKETYCR
jgi:hypothetical protein